MDHHPDTCMPSRLGAAAQGMCRHKRAKCSVALKAWFRTLRDMVRSRSKSVQGTSVGSGHVNPSRAYNPKLVHDIEPLITLYLCGLGYTGELWFTEANQAITYYVTFSKSQCWNQTAPFAQRFLNWVSPEHTVAPFDALTESIDDWTNKNSFFFLCAK